MTIFCTCFLCSVRKVLRLVSTTSNSSKRCAGDTERPEPTAVVKKLQTILSATISQKTRNFSSHFLTVRPRPLAVLQTRLPITVVRVEASWAEGLFHVFFGLGFVIRLNF